MSMDAKFGKSENKNAAERKLDEYAARIKAGESQEDILKDLPLKWQEGIVQRLSEVPTQQQKPAFAALPADHIKTFLDSLPRVPLAPGSRMKGIDRNMLPIQNYSSLNVGDRVFIPESSVIGEIVGKGRASNVTVRLPDGSTSSVMPAMATFYLLSDIERLYTSAR